MYPFFKTSFSTCSHNSSRDSQCPTWYRITFSNLFCFIKLPQSCAVEDSSNNQSFYVLLWFCLLCASICFYLHCLEPCCRRCRKCDVFSWKFRFSFGMLWSFFQSFLFRLKDFDLLRMFWLLYRLSSGLGVSWLFSFFIFRWAESCWILPLFLMIRDGYLFLFKETEDFSFLRWSWRAGFSAPDSTQRFWIEFLCNSGKIIILLIMKIEKSSKMIKL